MKKYPIFIKGTRHKCSMIKSKTNPGKRMTNDSFKLAKAGIGLGVGLVVLGAGVKAFKDTLNN